MLQKIFTNTRVIFMKTHPTLRSEHIWTIKHEIYEHIMQYKNVNMLLPIVVRTVKFSSLPFLTNVPNIHTRTAFQRIQCLSVYSPLPLRSVYYFEIKTTHIFLTSLTFIFALTKQSWGWYPKKHTGLSIQFSFIAIAIAQM